MVELEDRVPWWRIDRGQRSGVDRDELTLLVLDDEMALHNFWVQHTRHGVDPGPAPDVDLEQHWIAVLLLGERPTGGYGVTIREVTYDQERDEYTVHYTREEPDDDAILTQSLTAPYDLVRVLRIVDAPPMAEARELAPEEAREIADLHEAMGEAHEDPPPRVGDEDDEREPGEFRAPGR